MAQAEEIAIAGNHAGDYVNYSFRNPRELAGLQCVDAVSWVCYRVSLRNFRMKSIIPLARMAEKELVKDKWLVLTTVTRENLQSWIAKEMKNPVAIAHFEKSKRRLKKAK
jgi:hypothetical protein